MVAMLRHKAIITSNEHGFSIAHRLAISKGHSLVISKRHIPSFSDATEVELSSLSALLNDTRDIIESKYKPEGYKIGFDDGSATSQEAQHLQMYIIPYYPDSNLYLDDHTLRIMPDPDE